MRAFFVCFLFTFSILLFPQQLLADDFRDGVRAYNQKNFSLALTLWLPLAEQDNSLVQTLVGSMYAYGEGIGRDDVKAVKWFTRAAENGSAQAQYNLGIMYEQGFGVKKDLNEARHWLLAAANQGRKEARKRLNTLHATVAEQPATSAPAPDIETKIKKLPDSPKMSKTVDTQSASLEPDTIVEHAATPAPVPDIEAEGEELTKSQAITTQTVKLASDTVLEKTPRPTPVLDIDDDELTSTPDINISVHDLLAGRFPSSDDESTSSYAPSADSNVSDSELTDIAEINISLNDFLAGNFSPNDDEPSTVAVADSGKKDNDIEDAESTDTAEINISLNDFLAGNFSPNDNESAPSPAATTSEEDKKALNRSVDISKDRDARIGSNAPLQPETITAQDIETSTDELLGPPGIYVTSGIDDSLKWLQGQPANYYTIQLESSVDKHRIDARMKNLKLTKKLVHIASNSDGKVWYAILYGSFEHFNDAKNSLDALPEELHSRHPWIRSFGSIKQFQEKEQEN